MIDKVTEKIIASLHPKLRADATEAYNEISQKLNGKVICRFCQGLRTFAEQNELYSYGRTKFVDSKGNKLGIVTNARGGDSIHNYGFALDFVLLIDTDGNGSYESASWDMSKDSDKDGIKDWKEVVDILKNYGFSWGGDWAKFKDYPHVDKTFGYSLSQLKELSRTGKVDKSGYVII